MRKDKFFAELKEALDLNDLEVSESTPLNISSLQNLSIIAFIDENFNKTIKAVELKNIEDIIKLIGSEYFEK
jgi:acyl carrier protein